MKATPNRDILSDSQSDFDLFLGWVLDGFLQRRAVVNGSFFHPVAHQPYKMTLKIWIDRNFSPEHEATRVAHG